LGAQIFEALHVPPCSPAAAPEGSSQAPVTNTPSCVVEFLAAMAREEVNLRRALFVTVIGTRPVVLGDEVLEEVACNFGIDIVDKTIHQSMPEDFLLVLPDEETATRVLNEGRALRGPCFNLMFKRWSRFAHASSSTMSELVDIEVRGIPAHAWDLSTVSQLRHGSCYILELFPTTMNKTDYSSFLLRAWCFDPVKLHRSMELHIVEHGPESQAKRCLTYNVVLAAFPVDPVDSSTVSQPPQEDGRGADDDPDFQDPPRRPSGVQDRRRSALLRLGPLHSAGDGRAAGVRSSQASSSPGASGRHGHSLRQPFDAALVCGAGGVVPTATMPSSLVKKT
jgi:hypothetical protein